MKILGLLLLVLTIACEKESDPISLHPPLPKEWASNKAKLREQLDRFEEWTFATRSPRANSALMVTPTGAASFFLQSDGRILVGNNSASISRYDSNFILDSTFSAVTPNATIRGVLAAVGGGAVGLGRYAPDNYSPYSFKIFVLDAIGGTVQTVTPTLPATATLPYSLNETYDRSWVASGLALRGPSLDFFVARFLTNGTLDTNFNTTGTWYYDSNLDDEVIYQSTLDSDGRFLLSGFTDSQLGTQAKSVLIRLMSDGSFDTTFATTGRRNFTIGVSGENVARGVVIDGQNRILQAINYLEGSNWRIAVHRLNTNGTYDRSFLTTGLYQSENVPSDSPPFINLETGGKVLVGSSYLVRLNTNGSFDTSFNSGGVPTAGASQFYAYRPSDQLHIFGNTAGLHLTAPVLLHFSPDNLFHNTAQDLGRIGPASSRAVVLFPKMHGWAEGVSATGIGFDMTLTTAPLTVSGGAPGGVGNCGTSLSTTSNCKVYAEFDPAAFSPSVALTAMASIQYTGENGITRKTVNAVTATGSTIDRNLTDPIDDGTVEACSSGDSTYTFTLYNNGSGAVTLMETGSTLTAFSYAGGTFPGTGGTCGMSVDEGDSCTVVLEANRQAAAIARDTLRLGDGATALITISLLATVVESDADGDGYSICQLDCNDNEDSAYPGLGETCNDAIDNDCNGQVDDGDCALDGDGDGYSPNNLDCNDSVSAINPGATENCIDGIDNDCDGITDVDPVPCADNDGDGYNEADGDCNDAAVGVNPLASEICANSIDEDCNGFADDGTCDYDADNDSYTPNGGDCNESDAAINPGQNEICGNFVDDNCNSYVDGADPYCIDDDADGYSEADGDCNDSDNSTYPGNGC